MPNPTCPFCSLPESRIVEDNAFALWIYDGFPVSPGHSLIIPKRRVRSFFEISGEERQAMLTLLDRAQSTVNRERHPCS